MKFEVAIVDDEKAQIEQLTSFFRSYSEQNPTVDFGISAISSSEEFIEKGEFDYDIVFLETRSSRIDGFETAKRIRIHSDRTVIIFATNRPEFAINGYEVRALDYLIKPVTKSAFDNAVKNALSALKRNAEKTVAIENPNGIFLVNVSDILYIEVNLHYLSFHVATKDGKIETFRTIGSLKEQREKLEKHDFGQCMACYLVNLRHVRAIEKHEVRLNYNVKLPISRKFHTLFSDAFLNFVK